MRVHASLHRWTLRVEPLGRNKMSSKSSPSKVRRALSAQPNLEECCRASRWEGHVSLKTTEAADHTAQSDKLILLPAFSMGSLSRSLGGPSPDCGRRGGSLTWCCPDTESDSAETRSAVLQACPPPTGPLRSLEQMGMPFLGRRAGSAVGLLSPSWVLPTDSLGMQAPGRPWLAFLCFAETQSCHRGCA